MNAIKKIIYQYGIPFIGALFHKKNKYINVIYFHDIVNGSGESFQKTNIDTFKRYMLYIKDNGYVTVRFDDLLTQTDETYNPKRIIIAFDDGWRSNYTEIYDFMKSLNLKYNIFLAVREIGSNPDYLSWEQIKLMHENGLVGFGAHTYTHPHINNIENIDPELEFNKADVVFKEHLGFQPLDFCYPYGTYTDGTNEYITSKLPYKRIYTSDLMYSYRLNDKLVFGRNGINGDEPFDIFVSKLKGNFNIWKTITH